MNDSNASWFTQMQQWASEALSNFLTALPSILGAVAILVLGWLLAVGLRRLVRQFSHGINRILERVFGVGTLSSVRFSTPVIAVLAEIIYWLTIFLTLTLAMRVAGFTLISEWLGQIVTHLPNLIVGLLIITFGYFLSVYVGRLIAPRTGGRKAGELFSMGRLLQGIIFLAALIMGLDQFGIKVNFLITLLTVTLGALLVGFSLAFGLGARSHVSNLIAARSAGNMLQSGVRVRIGEIEGEILELTPSHIILDTPDGRALIPARIVDETTIEILTSHEESGDD